MGMNNFEHASGDQIANDTSTEESFFLHYILYCFIHPSLCQTESAKCFSFFENTFKKHKCYRAMK